MNESEYIAPDNFFKRLKVDVRRLAPFGFEKRGDCWEYSEVIAGGALVCRVTIDRRGAASVNVTDVETGDEYVQHRVAGAAGRFVGRTRRDVMALMERVAAECFSRDVFKTELARGLIAHAEAQWDEKPEFLWKNFPDYAVLRRKDTDKWYALVARLPADKIGRVGRDEVEIVNLRRTDGMDGPRFLPAYHMNKKTWTTIVLDGSTGKAELLDHLAESRRKAV